MTTLLLDVGNTRIKWAIWEGKIGPEQAVPLEHHDFLPHKSGKIFLNPHMYSEPVWRKKVLSKELKQPLKCVGVTLFTLNG
jgi:pantothenate kinase type III